MIVVSPFRNNMSSTFNATAGEDTILIQQFEVVAAESLNTELTAGVV